MPPSVAHQLLATSSTIDENYRSHSTARRMRIFFYDGYAEAINTALRFLSENQYVVLQLRNVPPKCVFPISMTSWFDYDMSQYCLCLGSESILQYSNGNGNPVRMRFDDEPNHWQCPWQSWTILRAFHSWSTSGGPRPLGLRRQCWKKFLSTNV